MPATKRKVSQGGGKSRYLALISEFELRPIKSDEELAAATKVMLSLAGREDLTQDEEDYLDVISDLVEEYEDVHYPVPEASGVEVLQFLIEQSGKSQNAIAREADMQPSALSEILKGKRGLNVRYITAFARVFGVTPATFMAHSP